MRVEKLADEVHESFVDICLFTFCDECSYNKVAPSCVVWYAYDYLSNNGYLKESELSKDEVCNLFYRKTDNETMRFSSLLIYRFIKYLNSCGYLKGVE